MPERVFANKYTVQQEIARGAMGIVYKALDNSLNRVVALKVVHPHLTCDTSFLARFLREARAMALFEDHENIVRIYSVEQDHGTQFMVMEYFPGTNLHRLMQPNAGLPLTQAVDITCQIAKALATAHDRGIIHRDVKPANVLIGMDDRVKLTDFGIAAALDETPLTTTGQLIGTLFYMSPEQAKDESLDGRSDLYSLGLMLYEMITGLHPRRGLSNAAVLGMLNNEASSPSLSFSPSIPAGVQTIVKDLLRYRPIDRIKDAHQLVDRLESIQRGGRSVSRSALRANAIVNDQTICELEEPIQNLGPSTPKGGPRQSGETPSHTPWTKIAAIAFGSLAAIALGIVGLNALVNPSPPTTPSPAKEIQLDLREAQERLEHLRQSVAAKDLTAIDKISVMSEDRRSWLEGLFRNYSTIEASLGQVGTTPTEISTILRIDKLILPSGETFPVGPTLQKIRLTVPLEKDGWGKVHW